MIKILLLIFFALNTLLPSQKDSLLKLWFNKPAKQWVEALPIGNGRLGAMIFGNPFKEQIQLNENTIWAGSPYNNANPKALKALPEIRKLIFEGDYEKAQDMANKDIISQTAQGMPYQTVGSLYLHFPGSENYTDYYRDLNLEEATATVKYKVDGVSFKRVVFASFPDQVIIVRLTADKPGKINFLASMNSPEKVVVSVHGKNEIELDGKTTDHEGIEGKVKFSSIVKILNSGGEINFKRYFFICFRCGYSNNLYFHCNQFY